MILFTTACQRAASAAPRQSADTAVARGEYLVTVLGCGDCHTPLKLGPNGPEPDTGRALSGHPSDFVLTSAPDLGTSGWVWAGAATNTAFAGPWGISYAPNLTPDTATGIGTWTEENFIRAIRDGKKGGAGREILPPMPIPAYSHLTDDDLQAMFAYLRTLEPINNQVPDWRPPAPPAS
jgi:mono/diheme cytochrome c family protein